VHHRPSAFSQVRAKFFLRLTPERESLVKPGCAERREQNFPGATVYIGYADQAFPLNCSQVARERRSFQAKYCR
jgi:hypothetical protein